MPRHPLIERLAEAKFMAVLPPPTNYQVGYIEKGNTHIIPMAVYAYTQYGE